MSSHIHTSATFLTTNFSRPNLGKWFGAFTSCALRVVIVLLFLQVVSLRAQDPNLVQLRPLTRNWGGLVSSIAVHPRDPETIFIGTGRGGVYKSTTGGRTWEYVNSFPTQSVSLISFSPSSPYNLIATAGYDTKTNRNGGIWLSTDQGVHWSAPPGSIPPITARCPPRLNAFGLSWVRGSNTVWVATDCGLMRSEDRGEHWSGPILVDPLSTGGSDWRNHRPTPDRMFSVLAIDATHVIAGGETGYYYMHDGYSWHRSAGAQPNVYTPKGLAVAPGNRRLLFRADYDSHYLQYSDDQGVRWQNFPSPNLDAGNASIFVRTTSSPRGPNYFEVYFGDGTNLKRATLQNDVSNWSTTTWQTLSIDHPDPQDVGFHPNTGRPMLLAADSGVMRSPDDGATWTSLGAGPDGLNALEIYGLATQDYPGPESRPDLNPRPDLYFVTWHNSAWASPDGDLTWAGRFGIAEGQEIFTLGPALNDERDAFVSLRPWGNSSELYGRGIIDLPPVSHARAADCARVITFYKNAVAGRPYLLNTSYGCEGSKVIYDHRDVRLKPWEEVARSNLGEYMYGLPQVAVNGRRASIYHAYVASGSGRRLLLKISNIDRDGGASPVVSTPLMDGFGTLSVMIYNSNPPVWAVKPNDDQVLIAADRMTSEMKMSVDGGNHWDPMDLLTRLVTDDDRLMFETEAYNGMSQATVIAFDPYDPERVMVGTMESGLLVSWNGGRDWSRVRGSEQITNIVSIAYTKAGAAYIGSAGRGVWKWQPPLAWPELIDQWLCPGDCGKSVIILRDPSSGAKLPVDLAGNAKIFRVLARKGFITNFSFDQKSQQFVLSATDPGSVVVYNAKQIDLPIRIVASGKSDEYTNCPACKRDREKGQRVKMLVLEPGKVLGYVAAGADKSEIPNKIMFGSDTLPDYRPKVSLVGVASGIGNDRALQGAVVSIKGSGFAATFDDKQTPRYVAIYLNGHRLPERVETDSKGAFSATIKLNTIPGSGMIECVQQTSSGKIFAQRAITIQNHDVGEKLK